MSQIQLLILLKILIIVEIVAEYWLGKTTKTKAGSSLELVINVTKNIMRTILMLIILLIVIVTVKWNEWRNKK